MGWQSWVIGIDDDKQKNDILKVCKKDCGSMIGNKHIAGAQHSPSKGKEWHFAPKDLYVIPSDLIYEIFNSITI